MLVQQSMPTNKDGLVEMQLRTELDLEGVCGSRLQQPAMAEQVRATADLEAKEKHPQQVSKENQDRIMALL